MVKKLGERFKQYIGNYEIIANDGISEYEENFVENANRVASLAYAINDMNRFIGNKLDEVEDEVTDREWQEFTKDLGKIIYALENCKDRYASVYNKLNLR